MSSQARVRQAFRTQSHALWATAPMVLGVLALLFTLATMAYRTYFLASYPAVNGDEGYYGQLLLSRIDPRVSNPDAATGYDAFRFSGPATVPYTVGVSLETASLV